MKRLFTSISGIVTMVLASCLAISCIDDPFHNMNYPGGNGGYNQGGQGGQGGQGQNGRGDNGQGGNGQGQTDKETFPGSKTYTLKAKAVYLGEIYEGVDDYVLTLYYGQYNDDGLFVSTGTEMVFDMLCPIYTEMYISPGNYSCTSDNNIDEYRFLDGLEDNGVVYPSYLYRQYSSAQDDYELDLITAGTLTISCTNSKYNISASFTAGNENLKCTYSGAIEFIDGREGVPSVIDMTNITSVDVVDWGQLWEADDAQGKAYKLPVNDWVVYFNGTGDDEYTMVEFLTATDASDITGLFNAVITLDKIENFKSGSVIYGYDEDGIAYGTWYCQGGNAIYAATTGQISIARNGDTYSFNFDFLDEEYGGEFKGSYTGPVNFSKADAASVASARAFGRKLETKGAVDAVRRTAKKDAAPRASKASCKLAR